MNAYATPDDIKRLNQDVVACRVLKGKVPEGCTGLHLKGEQVTARTSVGTRTREDTSGKLWWVRHAPFDLRFAPMPGVPEAGVELRLQVATGDGVHAGLVCDEIAWYLDSLPSACLTQNAIQRELTGHILLQPPPAMQAEEAEDLRVKLSTALSQRMGLECLSLRRVDLYPEINCALTDAPSALHVHSTPWGETCHEAKAPASLRNLIAEDARCQTRLFRELPRLAQRLRNQPWPQDRAALQIQAGVLQRLEHLAATSNRMPTLENRIDPQALPEVTVRLLAAECKRAGEGLDTAWAALEGLEPDIARLTVIVSAMETAVSRRRTPWWETP